MNATPSHCRCDPRARGGICPHRPEGMAVVIKALQGRWNRIAEMWTHAPAVQHRLHEELLDKWERILQDAGVAWFPPPVEN